VLAVVVPVLELVRGLEHDVELDVGPAVEFVQFAGVELAEVEDY
jgi:hypothetical protein